MVFSRRKFLCGAVATSLVTPLFMRALAAEAAPTSTKTLVVIELNGGNDGFNMVIPLDAQGFGNYQSTRSGIAYASSDLQNAHVAFNTNHSVAAAQATQFTMAPMLGNTDISKTNNLRSLYARGKLAVVAGVGFPDNTPAFDSHSNAKDYWSSGTTLQSSTDTSGWMGRAADAAKFQQSLPLFAVDGYSHAAMNATTVTPLSIGGDLSNVQVDYGPLDQQSGVAAMTAHNGYAVPSSSGEQLRANETATMSMISQISSIASAVAGSDYIETVTNAQGVSTGSWPKSQLKQVARMIIAGAPTRAFYVSVGGYDTHSAQLTYQGPLLQELSEAITEFHDYLAAHGAASQVLTMTVSDFGRRPYANASGGTDHGTSTIAFMAGDAVKGGMYGQYPSLLTSKLDSNGDAAVTVDFRSYLAVGVQWLGADVTAVLGSGFGLPAATLPGITT